MSDRLCWWHSFLMHSKRSCLNFSAVIITHLCTASTFFTLLSWLPTFFKDTFPDAKVTWTTLFQTACENTICVKATEYQSAYWDFSPSMWEKQVSSNYFWERELVMLVWCCCGWTPAGGSTSHQSVCLIPIRKSVYHMRISPIVHCLFLCVSVCVFDRMSACVFPQGWVFNVIPWFVAIPSSLFSGCLSDHLISQGTKPHMLHKYTHHFSFKDMSSSCSCLFGRQ